MSTIDTRYAEVLADVGSLLTSDEAVCAWDWYSELPTNPLVDTGHAEQDAFTSGFDYATQAWVNALIARGAGPEEVAETLRAFREGVRAGHGYVVPA